MKKIVFLVLLATIVSASSTLVYPQMIHMNIGSYDENNDYYMGEFDLGKIAPGQNLKLIFSRNTSEYNTESEASIFWIRADGNDIHSSMSVHFIEASYEIPFNLRGEHKFNLTLRGSEVGTIAPHIITFKTFITENVYDFEFQKEHVLKAGETKEITMKIKSHSASADTLTFKNTEGIPSNWIKKTDVLIEPGETKIITIKANANEEGQYFAKLNVGRHSSQLHDSLEMNFRVKPTLSAKLKAFSEGFSIIPVVMQPFYSLISILGIV